MFRHMKCRGGAVRHYVKLRNTTSIYQDTLESRIFFGGHSPWSFSHNNINILLFFYSLFISQLACTLCCVLFYSCHSRYIDA